MTRLAFACVLVALASLVGGWLSGPAVMFAYPAVVGLAVLADVLGRELDTRRRCRRRITDLGGKL